MFYSVGGNHIDDTGNGSDFPISEEVFLEAKRTLRYKGIMLFLTCLPTVRNYAWYAMLHGGFLYRHVKLFPSIEQYLNMFTQCGFEIRTKLNIIGIDLGKDYHDAEGPLRESWRKGDSVFGYASQEDIRKIEDCVQKMKENGTLEEFVRTHDKALDVGLITLI